MEQEQQEQVKQYSAEELESILKRKKPGRKPLPNDKRKKPIKTMGEDGKPTERHEMTAKRKAALERARVALYNKRQAKKQEALKHETKVSEHKTEPTATEHHTAPTTHLSYQAPSHQPIASSRPEPMYF